MQVNWRLTETNLPKRPKYAFYCFLNPTPLILAHVKIPTQPLFRGVLNISGLGLTTKTDLPVKTTDCWPCIGLQHSLAEYWNSIDRAADSAHMTHLQLGPLGGMDCFQETCMKGWLRCSRTWNGMATLCIVVHRFLMVQILWKTCPEPSHHPELATSFIHEPTCNLGEATILRAPMEWNARD